MRSAAALTAGVVFFVLIVALPRRAHRLLPLRRKWAHSSVPVASLVLFDRREDWLNVNVDERPELGGIAVVKLHVQLVHVVVAKERGLHATTAHRLDRLGFGYGLREGLASVGETTNRMPQLG